MNFKALNFDNDVELQQNIDLFTETYGESFPIRKLYTSGFWKETGSSSFKTIVGFSGRQLVCSVSIKPEPGHSNLVQLAFLAAKPDFKLEDNTELAACIRSAASSYGARYVYSSVPSHLPRLQALTAGLTPALALLPEYLHNFHPDGVTEPVSGSLAIGAGSLTERNLQSGQIPTAYVPAAHRAFIAELLSNTGIKRELISERGITNSKTTSISADARGIECKYFPRVRALQAIIQPSLLSASEIRDLKSRQYSRTYVFVNAADPAVSDCAVQLEAHGYKFSGFVPSILGGRDALVYVSTSAGKVDSKSFGDERTVALVDYLGSKLDGSLRTFKNSNGAGANA